MSRHHADLQFCGKLTGTAFGHLCSRCMSLCPPLSLPSPLSHASGDGKCVVCESFVNPARPAHICDDCAAGRSAERCIVCGAASAVSPAFYCTECVVHNRHWFVQLPFCSVSRCISLPFSDGCPRVINLGTAAADKHFDILRQQQRQEAVGKGAEGLLAADRVADQAQAKQS
jgi:PHD finger-like domain-containing protein 5A